MLRRNADGSHIEWHPVFWDFARYYGVVPRLCRLYRARTKGKVESGIKYVKRGFILVLWYMGYAKRQVGDWRRPDALLQLLRRSVDTRVCVRCSAISRQRSRPSLRGRV